MIVLFSCRNGERRSYGNGGGDARGRSIRPTTLDPSKVYGPTQPITTHILLMPIQLAQIYA